MKIHVRIDEILKCGLKWIFRILTHVFKGHVFFGMEYFDFFLFFIGHLFAAFAFFPWQINPHFKQCIFIELLIMQKELLKTVPLYEKRWNEQIRVRYQAFAMFGNKDVFLGYGEKINKSRTKTAIQDSFVRVTGEHKKRRVNLISAAILIEKTNTDNFL